MGEYNEHYPYVLGMEWTPVRDASYYPDRSRERGWTWQQGTDANITGARFFVKEPPAGSVDGQVPFIQVYASGQEDNIGPVRQVVVPCSSVAVSGTAPTIVGGGTNVTALSNPGDRQWIILPLNVATSELRFYFNTLAAPVTDMRILNVSFLYVAFGPGLPEFSAEGTTLDMAVKLASLNDSITYWDGPLVGPYFGHDATELQVVDLGEINPFWSTSVRPINTSERYPFTSDGLFRMEPAASNRFGVALTMNSVGLKGAVGLSYAALRITYTDETRIAYGGKYIGALSGVATSSTSYDQGGNNVVLRAVNTLASGAVAIPEGTYLVTTHDASPAYATLGYARPLLTALEQRDAMASHMGVQLERVQLPDGVPPSSATPALASEASNVLPQLSVDDSGGSLSTIHPYGTIQAGEVYGPTVGVRQDIEAGVFTQALYGLGAIRFFARHYAETQAQLQVLGGDQATIIGSIDVADFDELPEIVDGWKEVMIPLSVPAAVSGTSAVFWYAPGASATTRWEVLATRAPSVTGTTYPRNVDGGATFMGHSTYAGSTYEFTQNAGLDTSQYTDGDVPVVLAFPPPVPTGLAVAGAEQALSAIDAACPGVDQACIPTSLAYNTITWDDLVTPLAIDTFTRTESSGWGSTDNGLAYSIGGTAPPPAFAVLGGVGTMAITGTARFLESITVGTGDTDQFIDMRAQATPLGAGIRTALIGGRVDNSNYYLGVVDRMHTGQTYLRAWMVKNNTIDTTLGSVLLTDVTQNGWIRLWMRTSGTALFLRAWNRDDDPPADWQLMTSSTSPITGTATQVGTFANLGTGNFNTSPVTVEFDNYEVLGLGLDSVSLIELQREDDDTDWQTIMSTTDAQVTSFNDYEARIGAESRYRIRTLGPLGFPGEWAAEVAATIAAPGVDGPAAGGGVLTFTSNERQDGSANLAYMENFTGEGPLDTYTFPEADQVSLRPVYGRNYPVAARPTERGGVRFSRTLLVQQAAVASGRLLAGFDNLRDLAWADLSYVCVRDEAGDRWWATVLVPNATVRRRRQRALLASVDVIEVSDTSTEVDPGD